MKVYIVEVFETKNSNRAVAFRESYHPHVFSSQEVAEKYAKELQGYYTSPVCEGWVVTVTEAEVRDS